MPDISSIALVMLVQLLDEKIGSLQATIELMDEENTELSGYEEELLACMLVADELHHAYEKARGDTGNLPPYENLVRRNND